MNARPGIIICSLCLISAISLTTPSYRETGIGPAITLFKKQSNAFAADALQLQSAIAAITLSKPATLVKAREALKQCRLGYKRIESFLEYFFSSSALAYNMPPKYEVEEPYMEYREPTGLQVIEGLLFQKNSPGLKNELIQQAELVCSSAKDLHALLYGFKGNDKQLLESLQIELIRIIALGITGYDAPLLKSGIKEAEISLLSVQQALQPFLKAGDKESDSTSKYLDGAIKFLRSNTDFNSFNRIGFLTGYALPLQKQLAQLVKDQQLVLNTTGGILNYDAPNLFSANGLNIAAFSTTGASPGTGLIQLGKKLFFEPAFSGNKKISCATCHSPAKYFTDGLDKSMAFNGHSKLTRNAPSLLYAGFQHTQFWDGRAASLEQQVRMVVSEPTEMKGDFSAILSIPEYTPLFTIAFANQPDTLSITDKVALSISAFIRTLNPRNSRFDQYMNGDITALTPKEINGFNIFMGKAQCATCHFVPLFNGLTPPLYNLSELEVLGTTKTDDLKHPEPDTDRGRFNIFPIDVYNKAFKTPTVRNVSETAPYMHNGAFKTLEAVVQFYNKGGAKGLGLKTDNQTLSSTPLNLTKKEENDIVAFLKTLKDSIIFKSYN